MSLLDLILDPDRPTHDCAECEGKPACVCPDPDEPHWSGEPPL